VFILKAKELSKSFGGLVALGNLSLGIEEGEILGLIGPNGSGKTTLFNVITGFLKPEAGSIEFRGKDITGLKPHQICESGVARTFQLVKPFAEMTALQNVMVGRVYGQHRAQSLKQARAECREILDFVGLGGKEEAVARNLTLVDRKRLELARALATKPQLLLLDEMMAGLNPAETEAAMGLVQNIRDSGITVAMVEHIVKAVMGLCHRVIVLSAGEKIAEGTPKEVVADKRVIETYLGGT
jgi:branched-chain amino acid transport system ATP-binding protein